MSNKNFIKQPQAQSQPPALDKPVAFSQARAIIWQIKYLLNSVINKRSIATATTEILNLSEAFGKEFDKYLLKELIEQVDLKETQSKDKNDTFKVQMLSQELSRISQKADFLQFFSDVASLLYQDKSPLLFFEHLVSKLKPSYTVQLLMILALYENSKEDGLFEVQKVLKHKLQEGVAQNKLDGLPEYSLHRLLYHLSTFADIKNDKSDKNESFEEVALKAVEVLTRIYYLKPNSHLSMKEVLTLPQSAIEESTLTMIKEGTGLENLDKISKMIEPWEILLDIGHYSTYNYNQLLNCLQDFKDVNEKGMARTLLQLSLNHTGFDDQMSRLVQSIFEVNKKGSALESSKKGQSKEQNEKKTQMTWSIDNLSRLFRELYSNLNWSKVFEALSELEDDIQLDSKGFMTFLQLFNKTKPQNVAFPLQTIVEIEWKNPHLQLNFIENSIQVYLEKKDKSINFQKLIKKQESIDEIQGIKDKVQPEILHIWQSIDLSDRLIQLSNSQCFQKVRSIFDQPLKIIPEYLLLALSCVKPTQGNLMLDELLSQLLPLFLGNHINSIPVLQQLWKNNQQLMIRGIYELYKHDNRIMNLSRVLDITQEVKESLIPIVDCDDYYFAVNLGILAGKRDFLHYDVWLQSRIATIGSPFIKALMRYIKDHIIIPINDYLKKHTNPSTHSVDVSIETIENFKSQILEKSHFNKEKLCITLEHLQNPANQTNTKIRPETMQKIKEIVLDTQDLFPSQIAPTQNSEEIDSIANDHFQKVFSADPTQVDSKIVELIDIMQRFKESEVKKEQEVYACMLHSLFDEYRFLHKYPQQYLEKIAKLFGQIIKNKIIDGTLLEIALKFAFEAFRRDGRRQKFGIIVVKQFFDMLPSFPNFFKDIYEIRHNLAATEPQMIVELERLHEQAKANEEKEKSAAMHQDDAQDKKGKDSKANERGYFREEEIKQQIFQPKSDKSKLDMSSNFSKTNEQDLMNPFKGNSGVDKDAPPSQSNQMAFHPNAKTAQSFVPTTQHKQQDSSGGLIRINTPSTNAPSFIPVSKQQQDQTSLNIKSQAFVRPTVPLSTTPIAAGGSVPINTQSAPFVPPNTPPTSLNLNPNVGAFRPSTSRSPISNPINQQMLIFQQQIETKIQKALIEGSKVRIEDLIEDMAFQPINADQQEQMKHICNTTGKNNLSAKILELKSFIGFVDINLQILIHFIITKRIASATSQTLNALYIDIIRQITPKGSVESAVSQLVDCFKKCMLIDEETFFKVAQRANSQINPIKICLVNLGAFLGSLTLGHNRPILAREIDLKQLLVEGMSQEKLKYVVIFICRILKEAANMKSYIFKPVNPWVSSLLSMLNEIKDLQSSNFAQLQTNEITNEIDSLFKAYFIAPLDIPNAGIIKALQQSQFATPSQQIEISYLLGKSSLIPAMASNIKQTNPQMPVQQPVQEQMVQVQPGGDKDIFNRVTVSPDVLTQINKIVAQTEQQVRKMIADAVESSIVEILPPVVDRSVTIALITTRELVLKDFAFDGDADKILKAADLIVKNLAGSLALVTCREPLKMSLTTNLRKSLSQLSSSPANQENQAEIQNQIQDIASTASKENLELGCKLIKKAVIEKAQKKVREEQQIARAIDMRKRAKDIGAPYFRDESIASQFQELPPQLQPNPKGLTDPQFQVYEDFARLSLIKKKPANQESYDSGEVEHILKQIEKQGVTNQLKIDLLNKITQMNLVQDSKNEDYIKLWTFTKKWFTLICDKFDSFQSEGYQAFVDALSLIIQSCKTEDLSKKLTHEFLQNEAMINNVDLNILLIKNQIISVTEWDTQIAIFLKEGASQLPDNVLLFFANILKASIQEQKVLTYDQVPNLMSVVESISAHQHIGSFFVGVLGDYRKRPSAEMQSMLEEYFDEWVRIAYGESTSQKQDINRFFSELSQTEFFKDYEIVGNKSYSSQNSDMMFNFCKVMVEKSIKKALYLDSGEKRPTDRIDDRYIGCVMKLIIVLMKTLQNFNKHKFMVKLFDSIYEVLEEDSRVNKLQFNQKPYYSLLMNILTAINRFQCFNNQTQQLILISLAELFNKLNPNKYPAFAFAWIGLVSHKYFMPHFLTISQNQYSPQSQGQQDKQQQTFQKKAGGNQQLSSNEQANSDNIFYDKYFRFKDLIVSLFTFLKQCMLPNRASPSATAFYQATLRVCLAILHDFPEFFCDFHFNFVNCLPDHFIQLKNIILSAFPQSISPPNPFKKTLKVDLLQEVKITPKILSNYDNYLQLMNLREDLESYVRTKNQATIQVICDKMMQSEEIYNGRRKINSNVINAVVLFIASQAFNKAQFDLSNKDSMDFFKVLAQKMNHETRWCLLNSIVNELRYPNNHTYYFSCIILYLFMETNNESIQEQIARILMERLQVNRPFPWGLMISFRELIQNPKYGFMKKSFIVNNSAMVENLFNTKLDHFRQFIAKPQTANGNPMNQEGQNPATK